LIEDPAVRAAVDEMSAAARRHDLAGISGALSRSMAAVFGTVITPEGLIATGPDGMETSEIIERIEAHMAALQVRGAISGWVPRYAVDCENDALYVDHSIGIPMAVEYIDASFDDFERRFLEGG
jgi:hypothetical protein